MAPSTNTPTAKRSNSRNGTTVPSIMGREIVIIGDIKTTGEIQMDGRIDGNINAGTLMIGENGSVNGSIVADRVIVRGKVHGKITANSIELTETANVEADLVQDMLSIANGAYFDGKCARKTPKTSASPRSNIQNAPVKIKKKP